MDIDLFALDLPVRDLRASVDEDELDELAASMRDHGQMQSIGVKATGKGRYEVVFGARRTRAAKLLKWKTIRAELATDDDRISTDAKKLIENVQRQQLTPIEEAFGLEALIGDAAVDVRELQRATGKARSWIISRLELLTVPENIQQAIQGGHIPVNVGKILATIESEEVRDSYLKYAITDGCTAETAKIWANHADFAEVGIQSMKDHEARIQQQKDFPEVIEQKWNCFRCKEPHTARNISMFSICRGCVNCISPEPDDRTYSDAHHRDPQQSAF